MVICTRCNHAESVVNVKPLGVCCKSCFCSAIERRVRKDVRIHELVHLRDHLVIIDDGSAEAFVNQKLLEKIATDVPLTMETVVVLEHIKIPPGKVILPLNGDDIGAMFLKSIMENTTFIQGITILRTVLGTEVIAFAQLCGYTRESTQEKTTYHHFLSIMERKHVGTVFGLVNSIEEFTSIPHKKGSIL